MPPHDKGRISAIIFGASGGLAQALADSLLKRQHHVDLVTRASRRSRMEKNYAWATNPIPANAHIITVDQKYSEFQADRAYEAYFFTQALFSPKPLTSMDDAAITEELEVGLAEHIRLTRKLLLRHPPSSGERRNYCYIGSTSAYAGFRNTSVYCAVKHGLLGFVRAMNDEYAHTDTRFWLFSPGTVDTVMGCKVTDQDRDSFLKPEDVAERIVEAITSPSNLFEPEVIMRRRNIRFLEKP
jgi:short-subunit dehydrogenase